MATDFPAPRYGNTAFWKSSFCSRAWASVRPKLANCGSQYTAPGRESGSRRAGGFLPAMYSTASSPSAEATWASMGERITSPAANTPSAAVW